MAYWLVKTESSFFSHADREECVVWDGVRNSLALTRLRRMNEGDLAFVCHSGSDPALVDLASVASGPHVTPRPGDPRAMVVDLIPSQRLPERVALADIAAAKDLAEFALGRMARLWVVPVPPPVWEELLSTTV